MTRRGRLAGSIQVGIAGAPWAATHRWRRPRTDLASPRIRHYRWAAWRRGRRGSSETTTSAQRGLARHPADEFALRASVLANNLLLPLQRPARVLLGTSTWPALPSQE